ncbi:6-pyruvoyl-tetrahydropterin synthase-like protein [Paucimonas lemoignei]|uniref:6-pyruvoyl-tetrahydropterin synthase-like protein n=1 Tax=Paucimonas lemoignei TaxID=29443 RepID=A0A4R3HXB3_PAULE|nr:6-pyruvoyl-tetrahydropterin synthase-related protein [Paucimonas lemoignei]TCS37798.1 6-pyruvoyl-tetrahydropterin synthase-like protein [Paucimonas lemoignei]
MLFTLVCAGLIASVLGVAFLNSGNWPTGGDAASHLLYAKLYADDLLFSGQILPWMPEVFGGMPFLSYYFPLPFIVMACLSKFTGLAVAFKWGSFLAAMVMPGAVFAASRRWLGFSWLASMFGALGALAFLVHEQNSIWGGNLLSTLAGEFAYSYGMLFALLSMMAWARAVTLQRGWLLAALLEAASGFSHGFPLLILGFSSFLLLLDCGAAGPERAARLKRTFFMLMAGHALAFALLGGWLWPMMEMHSLTIPNDASFPLGGWQDLLPVTLWPVLGGGALGLALVVLPWVRRGWESGQRRALCYFIGAAGLAAVAFIAGDRLGVADIRFFPLVWLFGAVACGWLLGQSLYALSGTGNADVTLVSARVLLATAAALGMLGWLGPNIQKAPDWGLWNHSGLDAKPQWHNLTRLFPAMSGNLWSPRLAFEHDPDNNDLGSTRSLEALPMFLNHRPVLEGLYMESAVLGPAIYQVQSEISTRPSSPLVRFPSGSLDPEFAARHLNFLHADTILLRSDGAKTAIENSGHFTKTAEAPPFALYRVKNFDSRMAQVVTQPLQLRPQKEWMQDAFAWFRTRSRFDNYLPVYGKDLAIKPHQGAAPAVREISLTRNELVFETDAVGSPHLIKMAYHPRWHLTTKGSMHIAGPGFMLVVPQEKQIRLEYGHTLVGKLGMVATTIGFLMTAFLLWRARRTVAAGSPAAPVSAPIGLRGWIPLVACWLLLLVAGIYLGLNSPERVYMAGWEAMNANRYAEASEKFQRAFVLRKPPAKKEEALFWHAKSNELAGKRTQAKAGYRELIDTYHGFWVPEAMYTYILLEWEDGNREAIKPYAQRLREEYPNNKWTQKLDELK